MVQSPIKNMSEPGFLRFKDLTGLDFFLRGIKGV